MGGGGPYGEGEGVRCAGDQSRDRPAGGCIEPVEPRRRAGGPGGQILDGPHVVPGDDRRVPASELPCDELRPGLRMLGHGRPVGSIESG